MRVRALTLISAALGLGLIVFYCRVLFETPTRTPLLIIGSEYAPPWDLNPWRAENVSAIESLDRRNLTVKTLAKPDDLVKDRWREFDAAVARLDYLAPKDKPLLMYINLHGMVNGTRQPCLLVSDSTVLDSQTWLPLQSLIDHISSSLKTDRSVVLFLEGARQSAKLPRENSASSFAAAVRKLVDSNVEVGRIKSLSVLLSNESQLPSVNPVDGLPDPFTYFLAQALAGDCDRGANGGNGNRTVELTELEQYVAARTQQFATQWPSAVQASMLVTNQQQALPLSWSLTNPQHKFSNAKLAATQSSAESNAHGKIEAVWRTIESLRAQRPWHDRPVAWAKLIHYAVCLEDAAFGGHDESLRAAEWLASFQQQARELENAKRHSGLRSCALQFSISQNAQKIWSQFSLSPTQATAVELTSATSPATVDAMHTAVPFLTIAANQPELSMWRGKGTIQKFASAMNRFEAIREQWLELPELKVIEKREIELGLQCRKIMDQLLLDECDEHLDRDVELLAKAIDANDRWTKWLVDVLRAQEQAVAELPVLSQVCDYLEVASNSTPSTLSDSFEAIVVGLERNLRFLASSLDETEPNPEQDLVDVTSELNRLKEELAARWREMLRSKSSIENADAVALRALLQSGFLPNAIQPLEKAIQLRLATRKLLSNSPSHALEAKQNTVSERTRSNRCQAAITRLISPGHADAALLPSSLEMLRPSQHSFDTRSYAMKCFDEGMLNKSSSDQVACLVLARSLASLTLDPRCDRMIEEWSGIQASKKMLSACSRFMEDFWNEPQIQSQPYYRAVTSRLLDDLKSDDVDEVPSPQLERMMALLAEKRAAEESALNLSVSVVPTWLADSSLNFRCEVMPGKAIAKLPAGVASLRIPGIQIATQGSLNSVSLSPSMAEQSVVMNVSAPSVDPMNSKGAERFSAQLHFRGHVIETRFELAADRKNISIAEFVAPGPASILVRHERSKRRARTLVLDCSASMVDAQPIEGQSQSDSGNKLSNSKLIAARKAVTEILGRWRNSPDQVGVVFFGHRAAVGDLTKGTLFQERYFAKFPFSRSLQAFEDVETVLPIGRFSDEEYSAVLNRLEQLLPWGQTPLYLGIYQAIEQAEQLGGDLSHDVIVISDGKNYQFNPSTEKNVSIEAVIEFAKRRGVRIHVIGFGVPETERMEAMRQFERLASESGGTSTMEVANAVELVSKIESIVEPETFAIQLPSGESWRGECDLPIALPPNLITNTPVQINYRDRKQIVPVSPRSAIRLVARDDDRLVSATYTNEGEPKRVSILNTNRSPSPFVLGVHPPRATDKSVRWSMSLLRADGFVAQRPKFVWIEVAPKIDGESTSADRNYFISDATWKAETPVPVLQFETRNWPANATAGAVQFWCTDIEPAILTQLNLSAEMCDQLAATKELQTGKVESAVLRYQVAIDARGVTVALFEDREDMDIRQFAPVLDAADINYVVERQYRADQRMSVHRFVFPTFAADAAWWHTLRSVKIRLMNMADVKSKGLQLAMPLQISLTPTLATFPTSPAPELRR